MKIYRALVAAGLSLALAFAFQPLLHAEDRDAEELNADDSIEMRDESTVESSPNASSSGSAARSGGGSRNSSGPDHQTVLKDAEHHEGLLHLHEKDDKLYAELTSSDYNKEFIVIISIARGIGQRPLLGGYSWGFGDDWVWSFRKIGDKVHVIRRNVRFKATPGRPEATAVQHAYTDSVLFSLPIITRGPRGGDLVDFTPVFMSDLPQISQVLPGFTFSGPKSYWDSVKAFEKNVELQVAATYQSSGRVQFDTVPDSRGVTVNVHYSISEVPRTNYQPRLADSRVGYFLTVRRDFSDRNDREQFVRYINRWHLEPPPGAEPDKPTSPKEPIVFWIENTVPHKYRPAIRAGFEEWNKAFEKAGWLNAIEVRQQPDDAEWDPEDINYNTFRWITSNAGFAMGPSRVNPYTGQILNADIIFDASFLQFWKSEFETLDPQGIAAMTGGHWPHHEEVEMTPAEQQALRQYGPTCMLHEGMARQMAFGATAIMGVLASEPQKQAEELEKLIMQGLKDVTMHEVGHTLGLRHNFKASRLMSLEEMNKPENVGKPLVSSVMDYSPANVVPREWEHQGDYYTTTIGPYDYWAIEYGYKRISGNTNAEKKELQKIASRSGEPELAYATDEDAVSSDPDPETNRFDLGNSALTYAQVQGQLMRELLPGLVERMADEGDDYTQVRRAFNVLLSQHGQSMYFASRYVGGLHTSRSHRGDEDARPPLENVCPEKQRKVFELLKDEMFSEEAYEFPSDLFNYLATTRWRHWGSNSSQRRDFPLHDYISMWQTRILDQMLSSTNLERIADTELRTPADEDVITVAELIEELTAAIFSELDELKDGDYSNRQPAISSLRRNLQRNLLSRLSDLSLGRRMAPVDSRTIATAELSSLKRRLDRHLEDDIKLDSYSRAHLEDLSRRIERVLDANISVSSL